MDNKTLHIIVGGMFDPATTQTILKIKNIDEIDRINMYGNPRQIIRDTFVYDRQSVNVDGKLGLAFFTNTGPTSASFIKNNANDYIKGNGYFVILSETQKKMENFAFVASQLSNNAFIHKDESAKRFIIYGKARENPFSPNTDGKKSMINILNSIENGESWEHFEKWLKEAVKEPHQGRIEVASFEDCEGMLKEIQSKNPGGHEVKLAKQKKPHAPMPMSLEIALKCATSGIVDGVLEGVDGSKVLARVYSRVIRRTINDVARNGAKITTEEVFMTEDFCAFTETGNLIYTTRN